MSLDDIGMNDAIVRIPEFLARTDSRADAFEGAISVAPSEVLVIGGSIAAHATEFVNACLGETLRVPVSAFAPSLTPDRVGPSTVVIVVATTSADEQVLDVARVAAGRGAPVVVLHRDGTTLDLTGLPGALRLALPSVPRSRLSLYAVVAELLRVLEVAKVAQGTGAMLDAAAERARARTVGPFAYATFGDTYARRLGRTFPLLVGAPGVGLAAARWWQAAIAANSRRFAHAESTAEYHAALLAGFGQSGDVTRQVATLVLLRSGFDPPEAASVFDAIEEWLSEAVADVLTIDAEGPCSLAQLIDLAVLGELTSMSLAAAEGIDPGPAPLIDEEE
ncbi:MAG: SIS domain-containing protein [Acidimicrobiales bacterium]